MNEQMAINKVSAALGISSRALRYWEAAGLFQSERDDQSGWRTYDAEALQRIRVTDSLRKLDIAVRDIRDILETRSVDTVCRVLVGQLNKLSRIGDELDRRRETLTAVLDALRGGGTLSLNSFEGILAPMVANETTENNNESKERKAMENPEITMNNIRIVKLNAMRTAAYSCVGTEPEDEALAPVKKWIEDEGLRGTLRLFGFNVEPYPTAESPAYGFGFCATIPEGTAIPANLYEWRLPGGVYAELEVPPSAADPSVGWQQMMALFESGRWEWALDDSGRPALEEHVDRGDGSGYAVTILAPIKRKS